MNRFIIFACIVAAVSATDYCSKSLCIGVGKHIACGHNGQFDPSCPADAKLLTITDEMKQVLLDVHNEKRNFIAGGGHPKHSPACRMATMEWDDELAALAALNVKQCKDEHDSCHDTNAFLYTGQNIALRDLDGSLNDIDKMRVTVELWYSEVENSRQEFIDSYPNYEVEPMIGHFTAVVSERNIRVGCAASEYSRPGEPFPSLLVTCNYASSNMPNFPIYQKCSKAASSCTTGTNPKYPNLCSTSEEYDVNNWF